jgi:hypothetical protein
MADLFRDGKKEAANRGAPDGGSGQPWTDDGNCDC